jgi:hypothetical protein
MHVVACAAPIGTLEPAPLTSLPIHTTVNDAVSAFWDGDEYVVLVERGTGDLRWFRIDPRLSGDEADRAPTAVPDLAGVLPIGIGRVAFPVGSTGRTVFRVWRSRAGERPGRTRILGVRAGRSRRLPA